MSEICLWTDLGRRGYEDAWAFQRRLVEKRKQGDIPDVLLFVEHPPTYTLGRSARTEHVLTDKSQLRRLGASLVETDRGGDVTFHGPGQLVGYPILDLSYWKKDVHAYLRALESVLIRALQTFGVTAGREEGRTGVWCPQGKLAAIGVRVSRWVTSHGFALNVATDLDYFKHIVPCGIVDGGVSSMEGILRAPVSITQVREALTENFSGAFAREMHSVSYRELARLSQ